MSGSNFMVDFSSLVFYIVRKSGKSVTSYLLMNINVAAVSQWVIQVTRRGTYSGREHGNA